MNPLWSQPGPANAQCANCVWRYRGGPSGRKVTGNERIVSSWPARGAPVVQDGKVFFGAGIWPFMGTYVHCLDAVTGKVLWTNDTGGALFIDQPHNSPAFGGLAPKGYLAAVGDRLLVPNGRAVPAPPDMQQALLRSRAMRQTTWWCSDYSIPSGHL